MDHYSYKQGELHGEDVALKSIAADHGTPVYVYSEATLRRHCQAFQDAVGRGQVMTCFAVKANSNHHVLRVIFDEGFGADVVSIGEIKRALLAGAKPASIVFSGVGKTVDEIREALDIGILSFNVESLPELISIGDIARHMNKVASVTLRINPNIDAKTHKKIATGLHSTKFGLSEKDIKQALAIISAENHLLLVGLACHIGSQILTLAPLKAAAQRLVKLTAQVRAAGFSLQYVNLGGGLGVVYSKERPADLKAYGAIVKALADGTKCRVILEPGRIIVANAGILLTQILYVKKATKKTFYIVDAGMNDLMRPTLYDAHHEIVSVKKKSSASQLVDVVGPVCETGDYLGLGRRLPKLEAGDLLCVRSAGAYGSSMSSHYNSRPLVPEIMVSGDSARIIRRREPLARLWELESHV